MSDEDRLDDLLLRWEEMFEQGQDVAPEKLCDDFPDLIPAVRRATEDLKRMAWLKKAGEEGQTISFRRRHIHTPKDVCVPRLIAGQYRLDELLGEGGFGQVWRGFDLELKRPVAVKVPKPGRSTRAGGAEAFLAEAQKVARLEHPGIVPVHAVARHGSAWFIVSKLIAGTDLRRRMAEGRLSVREAVRIVVAVAEALTYAHERNIVHRDIKPSNLLLDRQGGVYVTDFGIALDLEESSPNDTQAAGTLGYMAPEQFTGESGVIDARTDIYGLGVVLYEMLTGLLPFPSATLQAVRDAAVNAEPPPPRTLDAGVPKEIQRICLKCLAKAPEGRYQTAQALADDLALWLNPRKRSRLLIGTLAAACLVASLLAASKLTKEQPPGDRSSSAHEQGEPRPTDPPPVVALMDLLDNPAPFEGRNIVIDRVEITGEIKKRQAHPGYHIKVYLGGENPTYNIGNEWNGFMISKERGDRLLNDPSYPSRSSIKMTCLSTKGPKGGGVGMKWHVSVERLDFLDEAGKVVKTLK